MTDIALPTVVYNNNRICCDRDKTTTTKGLKHLNLQGKFVHESQQEDFSVQIKHISSNINRAEIFTNQLRDSPQFHTLRNSFMCSHKSFLNRQITFYQQTTPQPAKNISVSPRLPASLPPKVGTTKSCLSSPPIVTFTVPDSTHAWIYPQ